MMNYQSHEYQTLTGDFGEANRFRPIRRRRWLLFALILIPSLLISQTYIFLQPAIYQSTATVLTMAATAIDEASPDADIQHVNIQKQILLGPAILEKTAESLRQTLNHTSQPSVDELRNSFSVAPEPQTNLVHLQAQGPAPKLLQSAVNAWIEAYLQVRVAYIAENTEKAVKELNGQLQRIDRQVADKRQEIEQFRLQHDILSTESADNQAHARLQGLNNSLNKALEDEVKAKAKLDAILDAISRNETVVPEEDSRAMAVLIQQAEKLRDQVAAIEGQYTKEYIELNPNLRRVREQLTEVEAKIAEKAAVGKGYARLQAEHEYAAAREAVRVIEQQLAAHKKQAADYTNQFAEHQAMQQELLNLETLQQETKQRLVDIDVKQRQKYPQVDVVDWASLPDKPISPDYRLQALLAAAGSLGLALMIMLIIDYLNREPPPSPASLSLGGIHLHHKPQAMLDGVQQQPQVVYDPLKALTVDEQPRALSRPEMLALYEAAELPTQWIIALLVNGLSLSEIVSLKPENLDVQSLMILIPGRRALGMTRLVSELMTGSFPVDQWPSEEEIESLLCCAAIDGGLEKPQQIHSETLRYTYMLYLVRQGIRLADLTKIVGPLAPGVLLELGRFSPEQAGLSLDQINLDYF